MEERSQKDFRNYYEILSIIGSGAYGNVFKGKEKKSKELRAIKMMDFNKMKESFSLKYDFEEINEKINSYKNKFIEEFENMKLCSINNINSVKCYEYYCNENSFVIIMELCDKNLSQLLFERTKGFDLKEIKIIMKQLNNAFAIMKDNKIIHRDLKLENILIKYNDKEHKNFTLKLTDYGCSKKMDSLSRNNCNTNFVGTINYMSPEILKGEEYNYKCDLWSIGVIMYRLFFWKAPFNKENEVALINYIEKFGNTLLKKSGDKDFDDLIENLLEKNPKNRLDWNKYLNHSFFSGNKDVINLIYYTEKENITENIFGTKFVLNNIKNIKIIIDGETFELIDKYELKKGENNIKIKIKNKISNLSYMFYDCNTLKNIEELKYLDTKNVNNFSHMFCYCNLLSNIKSLETWDVSNGNNFSYMFSYCNGISNIEPLGKWNVSNGNDFSFMFSYCEKLSDIRPLENWNVSNGINFSYMFNHCYDLLDISPLENWNFSQGNNFSYMFKCCKLLSNIKPLEKWDVSNGNNFSYIFCECSSLSDIKPLENWNVSNGNNFSNFFSECSSLSNIESLTNWNVSNGIDFSYMFNNCYDLFDISGLKKWNVSKGNNFSYMFRCCKLLSNIKPLENWDVSNGIDFSHMFSYCYNLSNIKPLENWNVSNGNNFSYMFNNCTFLKDIKPLRNWNVSKGNNFSHMFYYCYELSSIRPIENWNIIKGNNYLHMFSFCYDLFDIGDWNTKLENDVSNIFFNCPLILNME